MIAQANGMHQVDEFADEVNTITKVYTITREDFSERITEVASVLPLTQGIQLMKSISMGTDRSNRKDCDSLNRNNRYLQFDFGENVSLGIEKRVAMRMIEGYEYCKEKGMPRLYRIGMFAGIGYVTIKTLHHYEEQDILKPAYVNESNGYRYYLAEENLNLSVPVLIKSLPQITVATMKTHCFSMINCLM